MQNSTTADLCNRAGIPFRRSWPRLGVFLPTAAFVFASLASASPSQARDDLSPQTLGAPTEHSPSVSITVLAQNKSTYDVQDVPIYTRDWVSELQSRMKDAGFDPGNESGAFTERTRDTIKDVQEEYGLNVTGQPTPSLMRKLRSLTLQPGRSG